MPTHFDVSFFCCALFLRHSGKARRGEERSNETEQGEPKPGEARQGKTLVLRNPVKGFPAYNRE